MVGIFVSLVIPQFFVILYFKLKKKEKKIARPLLWLKIHKMTLQKINIGLNV